MRKLTVNKIGPILSANIDFGDLTFFVGPQATGKSILLQLIKLVTDKNMILDALTKYGYVIGSDSTAILERYFGEGMAGIWKDDTQISIDGDLYPKSNLRSEVQSDTNNMNREEIYYIPAQRVVCIQNGWPRFFTDYDDSVPYVLRSFSENLRQFMESDFDENTNNAVIFPKAKEVSTDLQESFSESIFHNGKIVLEQSVKKRFKLNVGNTSIPYMAWSAGQKEFMPLLLSFYKLCPPNRKGKLKGVEFVILEEPEMGLHPKAIESVILQIIELANRGYKVIISTHSPVLLEFAWAFHYLKSQKGTGHFLSDLLGINADKEKGSKFDAFLQERTIKTYHFDYKAEGVRVKDISSLDAGDDDTSVSEWGGLSSFSSRASEIISTLMSKQN